jgi:hypothetical protein
MLLLSSTQQICHQSRSREISGVSTANSSSMLPARILSEALLPSSRCVYGGEGWGIIFQRAKKECGSESKEFCQFFHNSSRAVFSLFTQKQQASHLGRRGFSTNCAEGRPYPESDSVNLAVGYARQTPTNVCKLLRIIGKGVVELGCP